MPLPQLTLDDIKQRCSERSFARGIEYFQDGAIGNPVLHGNTLWATCEGSRSQPYLLCVELMPTGIADTSCSCPYQGEGDCKHIVALLLTFVHAPEVITYVESLLATLAIRPKSRLLRVISEMLKRAPELAPIAQVYAEIPIETQQQPEPLEIVAVYRERIDRIFGIGFLEQYQLQDALTQLRNLKRHAETLAQQGQTGFACAILHALIHQSIVRDIDTLKLGELPRFVRECARSFAQVVVRAEEASTQKHCRSLLELSFETEPIFTSVLTRLLEQIASAPQAAILEAVIENRLVQSPNRGAHVRLLLTYYLKSERTQDYLNLARRENEGYRFIHRLFTLGQNDAAWRAIEEFPLSVDEYWQLLRSRLPRQIPNFKEKLLELVVNTHGDVAIPLYQRLIEQTVLSRKREDYEKVRTSLLKLRRIYERLDRKNQWDVDLAQFRKRHIRKRLLLRIIAEVS